jgi:hypothetical protein
MSTYLDLLKNWKSALAGGGTAFILVAIFTFIIDMKTMSRSELDKSLDLARADLLDERRKNDSLGQRIATLQEAYETLATANWDEPIPGYLKGRNGRYIQADKKCIEDLVLGNGLDANRVTGYTDYEIRQDSAQALTNLAYEQEIIRTGHPQEFMGSPGGWSTSWPRSTPSSVPAAKCSARAAC